MRTTVALIAAALLLAPCLAGAQVSPWMSYQGVLRDASGTPVPDGVYSVSFAIYDADVGGTALWTEGQTVSTSDGVFSTWLGAVVPMAGLFFESQCWLGVAVEGEPELVPRTPFTNVPYATHAVYAEVSLTGDGDWALDGSNVYVEAGNVGIGTPTPGVRLDVVEGDAPCARFTNASGTSGFTAQAVNLAGTAGAFFAGVPGSAYPDVPSAVFGIATDGYRGAQFQSSTGDAIYSLAFGSGAGIAAYSTDGYAGFFGGGGLGVYVQGQLETEAFKLPVGAAAGHVLTSDALGSGTWQPPGAVADGDWTVSGSDMYSGVSGSVGVGENSPTAKLEVYTDASQPALDVQHAYGNAVTANIERTAYAGIGTDLVTLKLPAYSDECDFLELRRGSTTEFGIDAGGNIRSNGGAGFGNTVSAARFSTSGEVYSSGSLATQGVFESDSIDPNAKVLSGYANGGGGVDAVAVYGEAAATDFYGYGVVGMGGFVGVTGVVNALGSQYYRGVAGEAYDGTGTNMGVWGVAGHGGVNWGVYGSTVGSTGTRYAGYFSGDVNITGTLYGGAPACRIDHPLDPENKYLVHSGVQSNEMMNVYNGNVVLDSRGEAWVEMPEWFEALNHDFRYQLTPIGAPGPNLHIAEAVAGGRFRIAGGEPRMTVSWMVTGVRRDPAAVANPLAVEVDKPAGEAGKYVNPESYGKPVTAGAGYIEGK